MKKISIGIPCYNEEKNIELIYQAVSSQMRNLSQYEYEIIFEDNASTDSSAIVLREIAAKDKHVKVILNQANFGIERSTYNCMKNASGDAYISICGDLQEPAELIPEFIKNWEENYELVLGQKTSSKENKLKYFLRTQYYRIIDFFSDYPQIQQITGFGLYDRKVLDILLDIKKYDAGIYTRHLIAEYGFKLKLLPYQQRKRVNGKSSFTLSSSLSFSINSLCNTSTKPLQWITISGLMGMLINGVIILISSILYVALPHKESSQRTNPLPMLFTFLMSFVQIFCVGMLGEYLTQILRKVTIKPFVIEKERINFDN